MEENAQQQQTVVPTSFPQSQIKFASKAKDKEISELQYRLSQQDKTL